MPIASRALLKSYFETNDFPTQAQFAALIDAMLHGDEDATAFGLQMLALQDAAALKTLLALNAVDNTSDANKPISAAVSAALAGKLAAGAVTTSGLTMATARLLGRKTAGSGAIEEIQLGTGLEFDVDGKLKATATGGVSSWNDLTDKPTDVAGFGITDAVTTTALVSALNALADVYQGKDADLTAIAALVTQPFGRGLLTQSSAALARAYLEIGGSSFSGSWNDLTDKPTTVAGFGITDPLVLESGSYANPAWITSLAAAKVGLGAVNNTSDLNKPISTATQTALNGKAATSHTHTSTSITGIAAPVFNVKDHGAVLSGSVDDSAAVQAAIDACVAAGGGIVYVPAGTARLDSTLNIASSVGVRIVGASRAVSILKAAVAGSTLLSITGDDVSVENLKLDGSYVSGAAAGTAIVSVSGADRATLREVTIVNANWAGVYIVGGSDDCSILDSRFSNCFVGVNSLSAGAGVAPQRITIDGCTFSAGWGGDTTGAGAVKIQTQAEVTAWSGGHRLSNNTIDTAGQMGVELWCRIRDSVVVGNTIRNGTWGISVNNSTNVAVADNSIALMTYMGIEFADGCHQVIAAANSVDGYQADGTTRGTDYGMIMTGGTSPVTASQFVGNVVKGCQPWGILIQGAADSTARANLVINSEQLLSIKASSRIDLASNTLVGPCDRHMWLETGNQNSSGLRIQGNTFTGAASAHNFFFADYDGGTHTWSAVSIVDNDLSAATNSSGTLLNEVGAADMPGFIVARNYCIAGAGKAVLADYPAVQTALELRASIADRLRGGLHSAELFTLANGVNEFDLLCEGGTYYLAYDNRTETKFRSASTVAGLSGASETTPVAAGRYPSIYFDADLSLWHLWVWIAASTVTRHYTATSFTGTYTLKDSMTSNYADVHVRRLADGTYIAGYKDISGSPSTIGLMTAPAAGGPWTDRGKIFATIGSARWHVTEEADPAPFEADGRLFVSFAGWDGTQQRVGIVEIDRSTYRAVAPATVLVNPLETWQQANSQSKVFNPVLLSLSTQPGRERLYYAQNPSAAGVAAGWGYVEAGTMPNDGRRPMHALLLDAWRGMDVASGMPITRHGSGALTTSGLKTTSSEGGAYGWLGTARMDDFTLTVEFTADALPTSGNYALLWRGSTTNTAANPIVALWIRNNGGTIKLYSELHNDGGTGNFNTDWTTTIGTATRYRATIRKSGTAVICRLNATAEASGTHSGALTGLQEWSLSNHRGSSQAASQQFEGTIHNASLVLEALPIHQL